MRVTTLVSTSIAIAFVATIGSVSASGQSANGVKAVPTAIGELTAPSSLTGAAPAASGDSVFGSDQFATLAGVKAVPMASRELDAVKGLHIHFVTPGGFHLVNHLENNLGKGQALPGSGPGYSGLCGAALNSPALSIPGQNTTTGVGGGC